MATLDKRTNHTIRPLATKYKGKKYRSRTEARWSIFFDEMKVPFQYEPKVFRTPQGGYLPDFLLWPGSIAASWIEVKGPEPIERDYIRAASVAAQSRTPLRFLVGSVPTETKVAGILIRTYDLQNKVWRPAVWQIRPWTMKQINRALFLATSHDF